MNFSFIANSNLCFQFTDKSPYLSTIYIESIGENNLIKNIDPYILTILSNHNTVFHQWNGKDQLNVTHCEMISTRHANLINKQIVFINGKLKRVSMNALCGRG